MLAGGAVVFVSTSAIWRSELTHRVRIPVALICCLVAVTYIEVRFSERPNPSDSLFSKASYKLLQSVIAQDSGRSLKTSSGRRRSIPSGWRQSTKKRRTKLSMSTESAMACDSAARLLRHLRPSFQDFHYITPTGASCPLCSAWEVA